MFVPAFVVRYDCTTAQGLGSEPGSNALTPDIGRGVGRTRSLTIKKPPFTVFLGMDIWKCSQRAAFLVINRRAFRPAPTHIKPSLRPPCPARVVDTPKQRSAFMTLPTPHRACTNQSLSPSPSGTCRSA